MNNYLPDLPDDYPLTTVTASEIARKHPRTIISWIRKGHLKAGRMPGIRGQYRIVYGDLRELLQRPASPS